MTPWGRETLAQHFFGQPSAGLPIAGFLAAPPCRNVTPTTGKHIPANGKRKGGVLDGSETITGFHCCFSSDAVLVANGGCGQQHRGKPDLYRQHRELQPDTAAIDCSSLWVHGVSIRLGPELSDRNRVPW